MKVGTGTDGMYFFLLFAPIILSLWIGDHLRSEITLHLICENGWSHHNSTLAGILVEALTILTGILTGLILITSI